MIAGGNALWESLSAKMKDEVAALEADWKSHRARWIEAGMPFNSPKICNDEDDPMMETGSDDTRSLHLCMPASHGASKAHINTAMAEEQTVLVPMSLFQQAQEE
ncbi:NHL repeat-containing protein 2 [Hordeum vulgare]|nr:NHL repeat-containing protein 2 [Hordeum vulgare]